MKQGLLSHYNCVILKVKLLLNYCTVRFFFNDCRFLMNIIFLCIILPRLELYFNSVNQQRL